MEYHNGISYNTHNTFIGYVIINLSYFHYTFIIYFIIHCLHIYHDFIRYMHVYEDQTRRPRVLDDIL